MLFKPERSVITAHTKIHGFESEIFLSGYEVCMDLLLQIEAKIVVFQVSPWRCNLLRGFSAGFRPSYREALRVHPTDRIRQSPHESSTHVP